MSRSVVPKSPHRRHGIGKSNRCDHCAGKFGLIRHTRASKQFCSMRCVDAYVSQLQASLQARTRLPGAFSPPGIKTI
jgi:hypothetical protein